MKRGLLLVALLVGPASSWSIPGLPDSLPHANSVVDGWQEQLLQAFWAQNKDSLSFCLGNKLSDAKQLFKESFPSPLPTGPADDPVCSNRTLLMAHLCSPQELRFYYHVSTSAASTLSLVYTAHDVQLLHQFECTPSIARRTAVCAP